MRVQTAGMVPLDSTAATSIAAYQLQTEGCTNAKPAMPSADRGMPMQATARAP